MNYDLIISDIKNYKQLFDRIQEAKKEIEGINHILYGIHGGSFEDVIVDGKEIRQYYHGGYVSEEQKASRNEAMLKLKKRYEDEIQTLNYRLDQVRFVLGNLPDQTADIIKDLYWNPNGGFKYVRKKYHRSNSSIQRQIKKDIESVKLAQCHKKA